MLCTSNLTLKESHAKTKNKKKTRNKNQTQAKSFCRAQRANFAIRIIFAPHRTHKSCSNQPTDNAALQKKKP